MIPEGVQGFLIGVPCGALLLLAVAAGLVEFTRGRR